MNVIVKKQQENRYSFSVIEEKGDISEMGYSSPRDYFLVSGVKPFYPTYAHAHSAGLRIAEKHPDVVKAKKAAFSSASSDESKKEVEEFYRFWSIFASSKENKKLCLASASNISKLAEKDFCGKLVKKASEDVSDSKDDKEKILDCLRCFAESAAVALAPVNKNAHIRIAEYLPETDSYSIVFADDEGDICCAKIDNRMLLDDVIPCGKTVSEFPYHSKLFFERYFEPIAYAIGNISLPGGVVAVPNHPLSKRRRLIAFSLTEKTPKVVLVNIPESKDKSWEFKVESAKFLTASMKNTEVKCIRSDLPTYYGRTGEVIEEIDRGTYKDIVVNFRRGLGLVVMTDSDIEPLGV